jgi:glycine/D-amino acid oxidase-like deaminating enzyme
MSVAPRRAPRVVARVVPSLVVIGAGTSVPGIGEVLADLSTTGAAEHPVDPSDPRRPALAATS